MSGSSPPSCASCGSLTIPQRLHDLLRDMVPPPEESSAAIHLLETNDPPLEVEMHAVRETITKEEARLRVLDENITHMQSVLAALSQKRDECKDKIRLHKGVFSPLRRFPPEILGQIFSHTIPPLDELEREMKYTSFKFGTRLSPWLLTRICSRWRGISLSFPSLWTNIVLSSTLPGDPATSDVGSFDISDEELSLVGYPLDMLKAQLTRSGNAPLRVFVRVPKLPDNALATLLDSSARWVSLELPKENSLCTSLSGRVPSLRKIDITESQWWSVSNNNDSDFLVAPALQDIRLRTWIAPFIFPWTQITCYQADNTWSQHLDVLPLMVNLLEAHLLVAGGDPNAGQTVVPKLRNLYLRGLQPSLIPANLLFPALEDLFISDGLSWLQHSPCQPKRLAITFTDSIRPSIAQDISDFFQQFPCVTDLTIAANVETNVLDVFEALGTTGILPNLQHIAFHFYFDDQMWPFDKFTNFIRSRQTNTANALQSLSLGGPAFSSYPDLAFNSATVTLTLNELKEDGLRVLIDPVTELEEWYTLHGWEPRW